MCLIASNVFSDSLANAGSRFLKSVGFLVFGGTLVRKKKAICLLHAFDKAIKSLRLIPTPVFSQSKYFSWSTWILLAISAEEYPDSSRAHFKSFGFIFNSPCRKRRFKDFLTQIPSPTVSPLIMPIRPRPVLSPFSTSWDTFSKASRAYVNRMIRFSEGKRLPLSTTATLSLGLFWYRQKR